MANSSDNRDQPADLKDSYTRVFLEQAGLDATPATVKQYKRAMWYNQRPKANGGLRLTDRGLEFIEQHADIKTYKIPVQDLSRFSPQLLIWLDKYLDSPFHITPKTITVMTENSAMELYLFSGDLRKYGLNKAMAKRIAN